MLLKFDMFAKKCIYLQVVRLVPSGLVTELTR